MPLHPNVRRCTHIQVTGHRCGSPALKQEYFCYFHTRMIKGVQTRVDSEIHPIALIESAEAIQAAIMHMIDAVLKGTIDNKRATIVLKALHIATRNSRNVYFSIRQNDMVREVPNYAQQYLEEHPELNPPEPRGDSRLGCPAEQSSAASSQDLTPENPTRENPTPETEDLNPPRASAVPTPPPPPAAPNKENRQKEFHQEDCHPEEAQAFAKRRPANEGAMHFPADADVARTSHATSDPTHNSKRASAHPPQANREKAWGENVPPLTTRQSERWNEIKKLEASIEGAMRGNWRDLRTVFNTVGLTPLKRPICQRAAPNRKVKDDSSPGAEKKHIL